MPMYPIVRDERLVWEIDPTSKFPVVEIHLLPEEQKRIDQVMADFRDVQFMLGRKVAEVEHAD